MQHYTQDISACLSDAGVSGEQFEKALAATAAALQQLRDWHAGGGLPLLRLPEKRDDLAVSEAAAEALMRGAEDIVLCGTGGSSLGAQSLAQLAESDAGDLPSGEARPRFHIMDNLDPASMENLLRNLDLKTARFVVISKSGNTPETVIQLICILEALKAEGLEWNIENHILALSEPSPPDSNALRRLCEAHNIPVLEHDPGIGGRFSVLSNVGLLPALMFGLDPAALRSGAAQPLAAILEGARPQDCAPAIGAAVQFALLQHRGISTSVVMPYSDRLRLFGRWFVQLWSESLGKNGRGLTPVAAVGPVDQHSQLQLFLDGPADMFFTIITTSVAGTGTRVASSYAKDPLVGYLADRTVGDLVDCQQRATIEALIRRGRPVRVIHIDSLGEQALGALKMHFMLETIIMGHLLGVDPFDQPAVEEGKVLTQEYLLTM